MIAPIRTPRPPRGPSIARSPRAPSGAPPAPKPTKAGNPAEALRPYPPAPPQWIGSELEWICAWVLIDKGWKIYGRQRVRGFTSNYDEADAEYQPAIPVAQVNTTKDFFRGDYLILPGRKGPTPGPPYTRGIVLDPLTLWTHPDAGKDRLRRGLLARSGYLLIFLDGAALQQRPKELVNNALYGRDDSAADRGLR